MFGGLVHNLERVRSEGYSLEVLGALSSARAGSTNKVYESKWKLFVAFCKARGASPEAADPPLVADFLLYLFNVRKCSPRTIASYRSALGNVLRFSSSYDPGNDVVLAQLIKGFERQRQPVQRRIPTWDLGLVLRFLAEPRSANDRLSLHLLTAKTVFLLSLASAGRCHSLAALELKFSYVSRQPLVIEIPYHLTYVPKQYFRVKVRNPIVPLRIEALPQGEDVSVCPVHTLFEYLKRVSKLRAPSQSSLFIPHALGKHSRLAPQAVGRYIVRLIQTAYEAAGLNPPKGVKAHDVRGIATSLRALTGVALAEVLAAGQWSQPHTFVKFYLKEFPQGHLSSLGSCPPFLAAGGMISSSVLPFQEERPEGRSRRQ